MHYSQHTKEENASLRGQTTCPKLHNKRRSQSLDSNKDLCEAKLCWELVPDVVSSNKVKDGGETTCPHFCGSLHVCTCAYYACGREGEKIHFWPTSCFLFNEWGKKATGNLCRIVPLVQKPFGGCVVGSGSACHGGMLVKHRNLPLEPG